MSGYKTGSGAPLSEHELSVIRRERLKSLALESIDLRKDPYLAKTQMGTFECRLCGTLHSSEGSYLAHSQGRKHQVNLIQRMEEQQKRSEVPTSAPVRNIRRFVKIGRPAFRLVAVQTPEGREGFALSVAVPHLSVHLPSFRVMSTYEQRVEEKDPAWQFLVVAAEPYETVAVKIPNRPLELDFAYYDDVGKVFTIQYFFR
jgi:splicing factor 3A subunit 2